MFNIQFHFGDLIPRTSLIGKRIRAIHQNQRHRPNNKSSQDQGEMIGPLNCTILNGIISSSLNDDCGNSSSLLEEAPKLTTSASIRAAVLCVMAAASLIGNLSTLISIAVTKKGTSSSLYTLLSQVSLLFRCLLYIVESQFQPSTIISLTFVIFNFFMAFPVGRIGFIG